MTVKNVQEIMRTQGSEAAISARREMCNAVKQLKADVEAACRDYFADVEQREVRLADRISALQEQADALAADAEQMKPALIRASVEGDDRALLTIQKQLADIEARRIAVADQIEMLGDVSAGDKM